MGLQELRLEPRRMFAEARTAVSEQRGHVREVFGPGVDGQEWHMGPWVGGHCRGAACTGPAQAPGCVLHVSPPQTASSSLLMYLMPEGFPSFFFFPKRHSKAVVPKF